MFGSGTQIGARSCLLSINLWLTHEEIELSIRERAINYVTRLGIPLAEVVLASSDEAEEVEPFASSRSLQKLPIGCCGCENLHGVKYNGIMLVCGLHPYGLQECPDFRPKVRERV